MLYKNSDQLISLHFHSKSLREHFEPSASGSNNFLQPLQVNYNIKTMVEPFNMYLKIFIEEYASLSPYRNIRYFILLNRRSHSSTINFCVAYKILTTSSMHTTDAYLTVFHAQ